MTLLWKYTDIDLGSMYPCMMVTGIFIESEYTQSHQLLPCIDQKNVLEISVSIDDHWPDVQ